MAQAIIGALSVRFGANTAAFEKGLTTVEKKLKGVERNLKKTARKMKTIGRNMSIGVTAPLAALGVTATKTAIQYREAAAQVEQGLKTMGDASGKTFTQLEADAKRLEKTSLFTRQDIFEKVTANMLTFGNVSGEVFDRAQQAALDLSQRLGQDLKSSTIQIGKALNDPIAGISALSRVGVQFTDDQKAMIKGMVEAGDVAGAQAQILAELERQYKGSAQAAQDAAPGDEVMDAWNEMKLVLGEIIVNVLPPLTEMLAKVIERFNNLSPRMQKIIVVGGALVAALGPVIAAFGSVIVPIGMLISKIAILMATGGLPALIAAVAAFAAPLAIMTAGVLAAKAAFDVFSPLLGKTAKAAGILNGVIAEGAPLRAALRTATDENAEALRKETAEYLKNAKAALASAKAAQQKQLKGARTAGLLANVGVPGARGAQNANIQNLIETNKAIKEQEGLIANLEADLVSMNTRLGSNVDAVTTTTAQTVSTTTAAAKGEVEQLRALVATLQSEIATVKGQTDTVEITQQTPEQIDAQTASYDALKTQLEKLAECYAAIRHELESMPQVQFPSGHLNNCGCGDMEKQCPVFATDIGGSEFQSVEDLTGDASASGFTNSINGIAGPLQDILGSSTNGMFDGALQGLQGGLAGIVSTLGGEIAGLFGGDKKVGSIFGAITGIAAGLFSKKKSDPFTGFETPELDPNLPTINHHLSGFNSKGLGGMDRAPIELKITGEEGDMFKPRVSEISGATAAPIAQSSSSSAVARAAGNARRRQSRRLGP